ncbi:MAG: hypothetical protein WA728_20230 [Xanthobacteraceae bacterium]
MANWKALTGVRGEPVVVNLDAVAEMMRFPEQNRTQLWIGGDWKIEVRQAIDEIFAAHAVAARKRPKAPHWSAFVEYNFKRFGTQSTAFAACGRCVLSAKALGWGPL